MALSMANSKRARSMSSLGNCSKAKALSGLPTFVMTFMPTSGTSPRSGAMCSSFKRPLQMRPAAPSLQGT
eukprot:12512453-Alexandrium_andersonii.AAC.1